MSRLFLLLVVLSICGAAVSGQKRRNQSRQAQADSLKAVSIINGPNGVRGKITFECLPGKAQVRVFGEISGLAPGQHGFHIHQWGDQSDGCMSMGPHFNPDSHQHGAPEDGARHVGDLGNIEANGSGVARIDIVDTQISLKGPKSIIGRGCVVHAKPDDLGKGGVEESLKTGNAGARVGCGVVSLTKSA